MSKYKPRILYIITQGILGGAQTHIRHLARHLTNDFDIHVAMGVKGPLWDDLREDGIFVHHIPDLVREISFTQDAAAYQQTKILIKEIQPDLVSTHSSKAGIIGRLAARSCGVPSVFTAHGWAFTEGVPWKKRLLYILAERLAAHWAARIICVSENDRQLALKYGVGDKEQLRTIHNGMPLLEKNVLANPGENGKVRLIMVARFLEPKDHFALLQALNEISKDLDYILDLVGDGPLLERTREQVVSLGLQHKVNLLGSRTDIPELLAQAHAFILISRWEGFPRSILEAMRAGLPVIASDVGGCRESVVDGETGFLIPRGNIKLLAKRLVELIENPKLRSTMGTKSYSRYLNNFTFDKMMEKTVDIYIEVLSKSYSTAGR